MFIDLYAHTTASDGQYSPTQLVEVAQKRVLKLLSITDHDTVSGILSAQSRAEELDLLLVRVIEICRCGGEEICVL